MERRLAITNKNEIKELIEECEWEWIQRGNISGALVKGKMEIKFFFQLQAIIGLVAYQKEIIDVCILVENLIHHHTWDK